MDSVNRAAVNPQKSRLFHTFAKVLQNRAVTEVPQAELVQKIRRPDQGVKKSKTRDQYQHTSLSADPMSVIEEDEKLQHKAIADAFLAKLFASVSSVKAAYAQMQFSQSPYDGEGIQSADEMVVSKLKILSELKQCHLRKHYDDPSPEATQLLAEIQEQKSLLKTLEIMSKKLDSELKLKNSKLTFLREKLDESNKENKLLEKRLNSSGPLSVLDNLRFSTLSPSHYITVVKQTIKSIRSFARLFTSEMESAGWDVDAAANSIEPGVAYSNASHRCFAFESFICRVMFDGFNYPSFSNSHKSLPDYKRQQQFFDRFIEMKALKPKEYLAWKPKSTFAKFCRNKYLQLIHPKMEKSLFGNLDNRHSVGSGDFPETTFFVLFLEMAKRVWLLHCLAFSIQAEASIFRVSKGKRFSDVYMECVNEEAFLSTDGTLKTEPQVAFTVVPGFKIGKSVIQSQVYLC